jgi:predicted ATPase/DNA-binding CsgD family transcriptional regulator
MRVAVPDHYAMLAEAVSSHGGVRPVEQGEGDSIVAVFSRATDALAAALHAQRRLAAREWPGGIELGVRIALHTAEAQLRDEGNYFGVALSRCARLRAIAAGGQTVLSGATQELVVDGLPDGARLVDCGVHRLRDLGRPEHVYALAHPDLPEATHPLRSLDALPNNLPGQLTSFVGRGMELSEIRSALVETRLLTLVGAGGGGKTRLALQAAADEVDEFSGGVWLVELAALTDPARVAETIAQALGVRPLPGLTALDAVAMRLGDGTSLLLLDNREHLLDACAVATETLLERCPGLSILATSRTPLGLGAETTWSVPPLSLPPVIEAEPVTALDQSDAVRLFIERARKVRPNFAVTNENAPAVAAICHDLDGIPLAIELAAARIRMLSAPQIATALKDRFRLLTGGSRASMPRQQTLRASVDWSHALLSGDERQLFRRLAAFRGGFSLDLAERVAGGADLDAYAVLDLLGALVDRSLVFIEDDGQTVRYGLLETIRQYALDELSDSGERAEVLDRHRDAMLALAERAAPELETPREGVWQAALNLEADNLIAAIERAIVTEAEIALRLCAALRQWLWQRWRYAETDDLLARVLQAGRDAPAGLRAPVLLERAVFTTQTAALERAAEQATLALEAGEQAGADDVVSLALTVIGITKLYADPASGRPTLEEACGRAERGGHEREFVQAAQLLATSYAFLSEHARAREVQAQCQEPTFRRGHAYPMARWELLAGLMEQIDGRLDGARTHYRRGLDVLTGLAEPVFEGLLKAEDAYLDVIGGRAQKAVAGLESQLKITVARGAGLALPAVQYVLGVAEAALGRHAAACERFAAVHPLVHGRDVYVAGWMLHHWAGSQRCLGDPRARATAEQMRTEAAARGDHVMSGVARLTLARLDAAEHRYSEAEEHAHAVLAVTLDSHGLYRPDALDALAEIAAGSGAHEDAARLLGAADNARAGLGIVRFRGEDEEWMRIEAEIRAELGEEPAASARTQGAALQPDELVAWARRTRGPRRRPAGGWDSLTPTEERVVALVAEGLTNPQAAERLFVSRATVKAHLAHVFDKLNVKSRSELAAAYAARTHHRAR